MASLGEIRFFDAVALTASTNATAVELPNGAVDFLAFLLAVEDSGTASLDMKLQHSPNTSTWFDVVSMTQLTASGNEAKAVLSSTTPSLFRWVRAVATITGTGQYTTTFWLCYSWASEAKATL